MFSCALCEEEIVIVSKLCPRCRNIKHLISVYTRDRIYEILDSVLKRTEDKQNNKIDFEIKKEKENLEDKINTRSKTNLNK